MDNKQISRRLPTNRGRHVALTKEKASNVKETLLLLWKYLKKEKFRLSTVFFSVLITTALNIAGPWVMKIAIDSYIAVPEINFPALAKILALMIAIYAGASITTFFQQWVMIGISQRAVKNIRKDLYHVYQKLSVEYFDNHAAGELMSRVTNDIDNISSTISTSILEALSAVLTIIVVAVVMLTMNLKLGLICLVVIPLVMVTTKYISKNTRKGFRDKQKHLGDLNGLIEETITGSRIVKSFTKEEEFFQTFSKKNGMVQKATNKANILSGVMGPLMNTMNNLNYTVTAVAGGILAVTGQVSVGTIAAFLSYSRQFSRPLNQVAQLFTTIQSAIAGAERVFAIMDETFENDEGKLIIAPEDIEGKVILKNVHFRYQKDIPVLKGIDIEAEPGQTIALVGSTGAGKTTIINLLTRFYDFNEGSITIDDTDIRKISKSSLRKILGIVLQDTFLFTGSVKENIRYGRLEATDEEIIEAARMANAHQFIHRMPKGYETEITRNGSDLSHGQRQLIAIARAILSSPAILILDEATSSVDTLTEQNIQKGMLSLMKGRTSFVIAHRLSTIEKADCILLMEEGKIIEQGTHKDLMQKEGAYFKLYTSQFI